MESHDEKLQEMQMLEQNLQNILMQKQAFQMELSETESAFEEIKTAGDEVFKIIGQLMIKTEKAKMQEELENKKKILELRIQAFDKQESTLAEKLTRLRDELLKSTKK